LEFGGLIAAVASGKVDMIAASIFITDERKKQIDFSNPYFEMGNRVFGLKSNIAAYASQTGRKDGRLVLRSLARFRSNVLEEKRYLLIGMG
jgi:polar amino acid transport system substrate-binding protein